MWNQATPPTIFVNGKTVKSDRTWRVTYEDKEWIDESGKASDTSATVYLDADCWNFNTKDQRPSLYQLPRKPMEAVTSEKARWSTLRFRARDIRLSCIETAERKRYGECLLWRKF